MMANSDHSTEYSSKVSMSLITDTDRQSQLNTGGIVTSPNMGRVPGANANLAPGATGAQQSPTADPEKCKLIQQQLVLLLHAHKCQRRQQTTGEVCFLPHCRTMKNVLNHMTTCNAGKSCQVAHCASSRQIITHWKNCTTNDCHVCLPLKNKTDRTGQNPANPSVTGPNIGEMPGANANLAPGATGAQQSPTADPEKCKLIQQQLVLLLHAHKCQRRQQTNGEVCFLPHCRTMKNVLNHMTTCNAGKSCKVIHCASSRQIITHWKNCTINDCPVCTPLKQAQNSEGTGQNPTNPSWFTNLPGVDQQKSHQISDNMNSGSKEWHQSVTQDLRNHLVHKLIQAIMPNPDHAKLEDKMMDNLVAYARKVEGDMYDTANSQDDYFHNLAEKIYKIPTELEEIWLKHIQQDTGTRQEQDRDQE